MKRTLLACIADTHGGHRLGLLDPATVLFDEGPQGNPVQLKLEPTSTQKLLWGIYRPCIQKTLEWAAGDEIDVLHLGDVTQGDRYYQALVSQRIADQVIIGATSLAHWLRFPNVVRLRIIIGTEAHSLGEASAEILISSMLSRQFPGKDVRTYHHSLLDIGGMKVDCAHHGPSPGIRSHLKGNTARYYLRSLMDEEIINGNDPPRLVLRGDRHHYINETVTIQAGDRDFVSTIVVLPPMCGMSDHARKTTQSAHTLTVGMVIFEIIDGKLTEFRRLTKTIDLRMKETFN